MAIKKEEQMNPLHNRWKKIFITGIVAVVIIILLIIIFGGKGRDGLTEKQKRAILEQLAQQDALESGPELTEAERQAILTQLSVGDEKNQSSGPELTEAERQAILDQLASQ